MKKFRIIDKGEEWIMRYRVDQRHSLFFGLIKYWDNGAELLCPTYLFKTKEEALIAIAEAVTQY